MNNHEKQLQTADKLAREVLNLSRNTLVVNLRFMDSALCRFTLAQIPSGTVATDGETLFYDLRWVLSEYSKAKEWMTRAYLHIVMHCIFRHMFVSPSIDRDVWDLACDIAVENAINGLQLPCVTTAKAAQQTAVISELQKECKHLTAEKIYRYYLDKRLPPLKLAELRVLFLTDDHAPWYLPPEGLFAAGFGAASASRTELATMWQGIGEQVQLDLETFGKQRGDMAGSMMQELQAVNREKYDYADFLRRFAVLGEAMQINDDEFDHIFYTYGLALYENMPLIEPLEYKEVKRIKEFVIAIDTSGSTSGELVQRFLNKTYNILKQQENFFTKINLHIVQCDADIQEDAKITSQEDFDEYLKTMSIHGLGGTDFRPVFAYVDELICNKEFTNLKGLIYFTDGCGVFPKHQPEYDAAFVFVDDDYNDYDVPVWAIKLILQKDEI